MFEDEVDVFLRELREARREIADQMANGGCHVENKAGGFWHLVGVVEGMNRAEAKFKASFRTWLPERHEDKFVEKKKPITEAY